MTSTDPASCLVQFAKAPILGQVKTRLQSSLGEQGCLDLHCALVEHVLSQFVHETGICQQLWCSEPHPYFQQLVEGLPVSLHLQQGNELGMRMASAFQTCLHHYDKVVLIGSDCPALSVQTLNATLQLLDEVPAAFVPAEDGGYVLVGLTRFDPTLFQGIPWGSSEVMNATRSRLSEIGWDWRELEMLSDIDRPDDLYLLSGHKKLDFFAKNY